MNDDIEICFATAEDLPQLADLLAELFTLERDFKPERDKPLNSDFLALLGIMLASSDVHIPSDLMPGLFPFQ